MLNLIRLCQRLILSERVKFFRGLWTATIEEMITVTLLLVYSSPPSPRGESDRPGPMDHQPLAGQEERRAGRGDGTALEDTWRLHYIAKLLAQRGQLGLKKEGRVQLLIDYLFISLVSYISKF